jgi:hypothetical protein
MTSEIDGRYENVFPDDHGVERAIRARICRQLEIHARQ